MEEAHANIKMTDSNSESALMDTRIYNHSEVVRYLLEHRANVNQKNNRV